MVVFPPAKINLGLNVLRKRPDGYHDLLTCFYQVPWYDVLEILPAKELTFQATGLRVPGNANDNLCLKAYALIQADLSIPPVQIFLHKILPMGAGLGGGSSDGAWTLRVLNLLFDLKLSNGQLMTYAAAIGSDCPLFIQDGAMIGGGRGELLEPTSVSLKDKFLVLVKPDIHVSTADAFAGITPADSQQDLKGILENTPVSEWKSSIKNDFETTVFKKFPEIKTIKNVLYGSGALYASMSGSGSAVFGIFDREVNLKSLFPNTHYWSGRLP